MQELIIDSLLDALKDSAIVLAVVFVFNVLFSFLEEKISKRLEHNKKMSPFIGALFGLVPQCGFSVIGADLYLKDHITMGTLIAIFIACSDEALPIMLSKPDKIIYVLPLLLIKFVLGFSVGFLVDVIAKRNKKHVHDHFDHCQHKEEIHVGCCHHEIDNENESPLHKHLIHPIIHSLKIFAYVFVINFALNMLIQDGSAFEQFLLSNKYFAPLYCVLIGLIPNCASSVVITNLFVSGNLSFGACLSGLIVNAGLGLVILLKNKNKIKDTLIILAITISVALIVGYAACLITTF